MKYCPLCQSEYLADVATCPVHRVPLSSSKGPLKIEKFVDIYQAADEIEAERIVGILRDAGLEAHLATPGISQLPVVNVPEHIISVVDKYKEHAIRIIEQSRQDQVISYEGSFI